MDGETVIRMIFIIVIAGAIFIFGWGIGREHLIHDIEAYGLEKVIAVYKHKEGAK